MATPTEIYARPDVYDMEYDHAGDDDRALRRTSAYLVTLARTPA